ncbi:MAG: hypothetical protein IPM68_19465 [Flavobacteriales bacterium]|nr:hypothetical protein [Flavobacteriales bacterium]
MLGQLSQALELFDELRLRPGLSPALQAQLLSHMGRVLFDMGQPWDAMLAYKRSLAISDSLMDSREAIKTKQQLAYSEWALGNREQAVDRLTGLLYEAHEERMTATVSEIHWQLHSWHKEAGRMEQALMHMAAFAEMKDSLAKSSFNDRVARLE